MSFEKVTGSPGPEAKAGVTIARPASAPNAAVHKPCPLRPSISPPSDGGDPASRG